MRVTAKKDLWQDHASEPSFTKGKEYFSPPLQSVKLTEQTILVNDQGEQHRVGNWLKHFKVI